MSQRYEELTDAQRAVLESMAADLRQYDPDETAERIWNRANPACGCCLASDGDAFIHFHEQCEHSTCPNSDEDWA